MTNLALQLTQFGQRRLRAPEALDLLRQAHMELKMFSLAAAPMAAPDSPDESADGPDEESAEVPADSGDAVEASRGDDVAEETQEEPIAEPAVVQGGSEAIPDTAVLANLILAPLNSLVHELELTNARAVYHAFLRDLYQTYSGYGTTDRDRSGISLKLLRRSIDDDLVRHQRETFLSAVGPIVTLAEESMTLLRIVRIPEAAGRPTGPLLVKLAQRLSLVEAQLRRVAEFEPE